MRNYASFTKLILLISCVISNSAVFAYYDDKDEDKCREPKIQEFNLPEYKAPDNKEVPAGAEFSFVVSGWADPKKIKVSGKDKAIPVEVTNHETFHKVTGKLPPEFTGKYVRLNVRIPAVLGCYALQGWLLKVAANPAADAGQAAPVDPKPVVATTPEASAVKPAATGSATNTDASAEEAKAIPPTDTNEKPATDASKP